mmetsp:Transcript_33140/g.43643  ORF Transcript_33140/g.43643 Transcript_33140/m.43643 type:complete len:290 (+) Transcript_33140:99-968(+)|eukprot:CAMPEP_0117753496 /NCGR_PEP_ID=MMETSP0947-20121206/12262_1 /TAXON_ID=44440 /ORGANISM="Chattonella subsalsa, Strain CCMP2191" /LENGTH=289 /DNA_ID=CAMNT_0005572393 /DNA_START=94 /DNA_END=963 /DNA_ORIENTATION=+
MGVIAWVGFVASLALLGVSTWPVAFWYGVYKLEKPKYSVLRELGSHPKIELRRYDPFIVAEIAVKGSNMSTVLSHGFQNIAEYIFGNNTLRECSGTQDECEHVKTSEIISMTSPVRLEGIWNPKKKSKANPEGAEAVFPNPPPGGPKWLQNFIAQQNQDSEPMKVSFMMPSTYTMDSLPQPNNPAITFKEIPEHLFAVIPFSGKCPTESEVQLYKEQLTATAEQEHLAVLSDLIVSQYHPPAAPGVIRKNEVGIVVEYMAINGDCEKRNFVEDVLALSGSALSERIRSQ